MAKRVFDFSSLVVLISFFSFFYSCDKEFDGAGADILDDDEYLLETPDDFSVVVTNMLTGPVKSDGLPVNSLGVYTHPVLGEIDNSFVTQVELSEYGPVLGDDMDIESVKLSVPYFSTLVSIDSEGNGVYELDSIYGDLTSKLNLKVYESLYHIKDGSGSSTGKKDHYSGEESKVMSNKVEEALFDEDISISNKMVTYKNENDEEVRLSPGILVDLDKNFIKEKIFKADPDVLSASDKFKNYFNGLFFKTEKVDAADEGVLMHLNFSQAKIIITYKDTAAENINKIMYVNLSGNTINFFNQNAPTKINERILLQGGAGAMAEVKLFTDEELQELQNNPWLINEAALIFQVDADAMKLSQGVINAPERLYLHDAIADSPIVDYSTDFSIGSSFKQNKNVFSGIGIKNSDKNIVEYKVRITKYIHNVIQNDTITSDDIKLHLSLTDNIVETTTFDNQATELKVPVAHVISPFGTILYNESAVDGKKIKLKISYSKPKQ